jgi:hypothetical protein
MLDAIEHNPALQGITRRACAENETKVEICPALLAGNDLDDSLIKILKVDDYYNTQDFAAPPKSIDCLIIVKCESGAFELTLVELRDVKATQGVKPRDIIEKFRTTFTRFLAQDFADIFGNPDYEIVKIRAWLVSDPFRALSDEEYQRKVRDSALAVFQSEKPFVFRQHRVMITPLRLRPKPEICTC